MTISTAGSTQEIDGVATLQEPIRRALYDFVAESNGDISRDQAARALEIKRELAAFHLDKLSDEGLLAVRFERLTGRKGPGAGRPSKLYRRSGRQISVTIPPRQYELAAKLFAQALDQPDGGSASENLSTVAHSFGYRLGLEDAAPGEQYDRAADITTILATYGFEPEQGGGGEIHLRNCPFHTLARDHRQLVCGMNLCLMKGLLEGIGDRVNQASLTPRPGQCCVTFRPKPTALP